MEEIIRAAEMHPALKEMLETAVENGWILAYKLRFYLKELNVEKTDRKKIDAFLEAHHVQRLDDTESTLLYVKEVLEENLQGKFDWIAPRQAEIMMMRFGLNGERKSLEEVGAHFGLTRDEVVETERTMMHRLLLRHSPPKRVKKISEFYQ